MKFFDIRDRVLHSMTSQETEAEIEKNSTAVSGGKEIQISEKTDSLVINIKAGTTHSPAMKAARASGATGVKHK